MPGHKGGESETMIGEWLSSRGMRGDMLIATKTNVMGKPGGLHPAKLAEHLADSGLYCRYCTADFLMDLLPG